ncbi:MAG: hypothetical protein KAQ70_04830, partial [Candidatus Heimdallarchaeota archaeon]|nr:hypothetical protein [Candidatus Heimdallarchaeota archaeon]
TFDNVNIQTELRTNAKDIQELDKPEMSSPKTITRSLIKMEPESFDKSHCYDFIEKMNDLHNNYSAFLWSSYFRKSSLLTKKDYVELAKKSLKAEHWFWKDNNIPFFALHALQDLLYYFPEETKNTISEEVKELKKKLKIKPRSVS